MYFVHTENDDQSTNLTLLKSKLLALSDSDAQQQIAVLLNKQHYIN